MATQHTAALGELMAQVPLAREDRFVKNHEARLHRPAAIVRPTEIRHVQECVRWALKHGASLTVIGGGHSGHCLMPDVVAVDMSAFDRVHILRPAAEEEEEEEEDQNTRGPLVVAEAGCTTGDVVRATSAAGLAVPLGARPSVGAGLWLQGGLGHLARLHGLACDAVVGAVVVGAEDGEVLCVGRVPDRHRPPGAAVVRPGDGDGDDDLLWALRGAGTNFGVVVSVTFEARAAPAWCEVRNWVVPLDGGAAARRGLGQFARAAGTFPRDCCADAYLYWEDGQIRLGVTEFHFQSSAAPRLTSATSPMPSPTCMGAVLGPEDSCQAADAVGLFDVEMYMSVMHGGHGSGRTSSFKRCLFLKNIGAAEVANILVTAVENRPSPFCYLHLLQGGGAVGDVAAEATAFGCRDWDFACVVTGVWPGDEDESDREAAQDAAVRWVYSVAGDLLGLDSCTGAYGADLGPDPRDAGLAARAFGPNAPRLARLKRRRDPRDVLAHACPLPRAPAAQEGRMPGLILLVTGDSGAGKDFCAGAWAAELGPAARAASISDATKQAYAAAAGADLGRLLGDRRYKEAHRPALTAFFRAQVRRRPQLPEEHFLGVVRGHADADVLLVTGLREEAPVAALAHLVPDRRLLEVRVRAGAETRRSRRGGDGGDDGDGDGNSSSKLAHSPDLVFDNDAPGDAAARRFARAHLVPLVRRRPALRRLGGMVGAAAGFPRPGVAFRHVLDIAQRPGGLSLCAGLLRDCLGDGDGGWARVGAVACCEAGGFVFASALAARVGAPLALVRGAGRLPPPVASAAWPSSHISSSPTTSAGGGGGEEERRMEVGLDVLRRAGASSSSSSSSSVVVVDDVLASGRTLCAVLRLLGAAGVGPAGVRVLVVAEFPLHRGRELLRRSGFGGVRVQSLLVFDGA